MSSCEVEWAAYRKKPPFRESGTGRRRQGRFLESTGARTVPAEATHSHATCTEASSTSSKSYLPASSPTPSSPALRGDMASAGAQDPLELSWIEIRTIRIVFNADFKVSEDLDVFVKDLRKERKTMRVPRSPGESERSYTWKLKKECNAHPGDAIRITSFYSRRYTMSASRKKIDDFKFTVDAVIAFYEQSSPNDKDFEYSLSGSNCTLFLNVALEDASSMMVPDPSVFNDIDAMGENIDKLPSSSLSDGTMSALRGVFGSIPENVDVETLDKVVGTLKTLSATHPLINIAVKALLIPYELFRRQHQFVEDMKTLASDMCNALKSMASAFALLEPTYRRDYVVNLLRVIVQASKYVNDFLNKGGTNRLAASQFRYELDDYRKQLQGRRDDFRETALVQVLINTGAIKNRGDDMSFLRRKLDPPKQSPMDGGCMAGTRKTVLSDVDTWLKNCDEDNVLWVSGAPGAGKTSVASTIVRKLLTPDSESLQSYHCAKFFIKRSDIGLRDPRSIWRSIANELADVFRTVKVDVLEVMSGAPGRSYPENALIPDQFRDLICKPLRRCFSLGSASVRGVVVVIDALDECDEIIRGDWREFLNTVVQWNEKLPRACKLIITGRSEADIVAKLNSKAIRRLPLETDLPESINDIRIFLDTEFKTIRARAIEDGNEDFINWPAPEVIEQLTIYAAGLFIWARIVVDFVGERDIDSVGRLEEVLGNIANFPGQDPLELLYGQILIKISSRLRLPKEFDSLSLVLASLVLIIDPPPKSMLHELLAPDCQPVSDRTRSARDINAAIKSLTTVIATDEDELSVRAFHKSFPDFLQNEHRIRTTVNILLGDAPDSKRKLILATFSLARQHALLAECCLQLMNSTLAISSDKAVVEADVPATYACQHWVYHLKGAGIDTHGVVNGDIHLVTLIGTFAQDHIFQWMDLLSQRTSLSEALGNLRKEIDRLVASPWSNDTISAMQGHLISIADNIDIEALDYVQTVMKNSSGFCQFADIVVRVLLSPYELLKRQHGLIAGLRIAATKQCPSLSHMANTLTQLKREDTIDPGIEVLEVIVKALQHALDFVRKRGSSGVATTPRFLKELSGYRMNLEGRFLDFREGVVVQKLIRAHAINGPKDIVPFLQHKLHPASQLPNDGECLDGTRKTILSNVDAWLQSNDSNVFWISGAPGAGKTALASTIVRTLHDSELYKSYCCAKFFIKRRDTVLREPRTIWCSVAFDLAKLDRGYRIDLCDSLSAKGTIVDADSTLRQFRQLIFGPLQRLFSDDTSPFRTLVIIIDALDECFPENPDDFQDLLATIASWSEEVPQACKLIITSRVEPEIVGVLNGICHQLPLDTGDVVSKESSDDIQHFFETEFQAMKSGKVGWPNPDSVLKLTEYASGVFAWAMTAIEYVRENPDKHLKDVLDHIGEPTGDVHQDKLGGLYALVLCKNTLQYYEAPEMENLSLVITSVVLLREPLPVKGLENLLDFAHCSLDVGSVIRRFKPVIITEGADELLRARHRSFSEFLLDEARVGVSLELISRGTAVSELILTTFSRARRNAQAGLAEGCLRLMSRTLKFNIRKIPSSHCHYSAAPSYSPAQIPVSLNYACRYWMDHFQDAHIGEHNITAGANVSISLVKAFLWRHALHWLEVLETHLTKVPFEMKLMLIADFMEDFDPETACLARDASKFIETFKPAMKFNASHIYISALPFAPNNSQISKVFGPEFKNTLSLVSGRHEDWDSLRETQNTYVGMFSRVSFRMADHRDLHFATCGRYSIAAMGDASKDFTYPVGAKTLRVLAMTKDFTRCAVSCEGEVIIYYWRNLSASIAKQRESSISIKVSVTTSATFLGNETLVLGSLDGKVVIYDLPVSVGFRDLRNDEQSESFSSGMDDGLCPWYGAPQTLSESHKDIINSLATSPNCSHFVSGSSDKSLIVWDGKKREMLHHLHGHNGAVRAVAWSANGKFIASGSDDCTIRIWNSDGASLKVISSCGGAISSVGFCYNNFVVSGSQDGSIRFWARGSGNPIGEPFVRDSAVNAFAFSQDRTCIAAIYEDSVVCLWDTRANGGFGTQQASSGYHKGLLLSIAFDSECKRIASGSTTGEVHVWDVESGKSLATWIRNRGAIFNVQFSSKRNCIFAASSAGELLALCPSDESDIRSADITTHFKQWPLAISPGGRDLPDNLACLSESDKCITIWQLSDDRYLRTGDLEGHNSRITAISFSSDGCNIISASDDRTIRLWKIDSAQQNGHSAAYRIINFSTGCSHVFSLQFSSNGRHFVAGTTVNLAGTSKNRNRFEKWDVEGSLPNLEGPIMLHSEFDFEQFGWNPDVLADSSWEPTLFPPCADLSADGGMMGRSTDSRGFDVSGGEIRKRPRIFFRTTWSSDVIVTAIKFSPAIGGKCLATGGGLLEPNVKLWAFDDLEKTPSTQRAPGHAIRVAFDSHGRRISAYQKRSNALTASALQEYEMDESESSESVCFVDGIDHPIIGDGSYLITSATSNQRPDVPVGFVCGEDTLPSDPEYDQKELGPVLFWLPPENRDGFWWPRNTAVMARNVTRIDFSRFMHGENWHLCRTADEDESR